MNYSGSLSDFSMVDTMHYVHYHKHSGVLYIDELGGKSTQLHFHMGECICAVRPGVPSIGRILRDRGHVTNMEIDKALEIQSKYEKKPLGQILEELGFVNHAMIRDAVIFQIETALYELINVKEGMFRFESGEVKMPDDIRVVFGDMLLPQEVNTAYMLLNALRKLDEQNNANEFEAEVKSSEDLSFSIKLLKEMLEDLGHANQVERVTAQFLTVLSEHTKRAILFIKSDSEFVGIGGFGQTLKGKSVGDFSKRLRLSPKASLTLERMIETKKSFFGTAEEKWIKDLYQWIGAPKNPEMAMILIQSSDGPKAFVYTDNGDQIEFSSFNHDLIELAGMQTGLLIENVYLRKKLNNIK